MSARQPVTIDDLPPEVLGRAIAFLRDPLDDFAQPEQTVQSLGNLLAASLVSKLWSELAQHELCARLEVPRSELMENRAGWWIASPARKKFKTFELRLPGGHDAPWMGEVLAACPDVRRLTLLQAESIDRGSWKALLFLPSGFSTLSHFQVYNTAHESARKQSSPSSRLLRSASKIGRAHV